MLLKVFVDDVTCKNNSLHIKYYTLSLTGKAPESTRNVTTKQVQGVIQAEYQGLREFKQKQVCNVVSYRYSATYRYTYLQV